MSLFLVVGGWSSLSPNGGVGDHRSRARKRKCRLAGDIFRGQTPFFSRVLPYTLGRETPVLEHVRAIGKLCGGGTYLEAPLKEMLRRDIRVDNALFITDTMEWGKGWLGYWKQYRRRNPHARAFLLRLDSYRTQCFPPDEAEALGIHQIFGWSDAVVDYMRLALEKA